MDIKILKDLFQLTIDLWKCQDQTGYKRIMVYPGLLKSESGAVEQDRSGKPDGNFLGFTEKS